jgi:hypothetical protein
MLPAPNLPVLVELLGRFRYMAKQRTPLSREGALAFFPLWSEEDRAIARTLVERLNPTVIYHPPSGQYVSLRDAAGKGLAWLEAGQIWVADGERVRLSRNLVTEAGERQPEAVYEVCPDCHMVLAANGSCSCDA